MATVVSDSYEKIQQCLNCEREKCNNCLDRIKKGPRQFTEEELEIIFDLSIPQSVAAKKVCVGVIKIREMRTERYGKINVRKKWMHEDNIWIIEHSNKEIAAKYNISIDTARVRKSKARKKLKEERGENES